MRTLLIDAGRPGLEIELVDYENFADWFQRATAAVIEETVAQFR